MKKRGFFGSFLLGLALLVLVNLAGSLTYKRWDLTEDKRFTLAPESEQVVAALEGPVVVDILLDGDLPAEFERLRRETGLLLEQFATGNPEIRFAFMDPLEGGEAGPDVLEQLQQFGLKPASVTTEEGGRVSQEVVFPWAVVNYGGRSEKVALLRNQLGATTEERVNRSIQNLEYAFADAFAKLGTTDRKQIAVLKGNGEVPDSHLADLLGTLGNYYNIAPFTLDSVATNPAGTLAALREFQAALIAKPTEPFTEAEKLVLDQYMVGGGKALWLVDPVAMELDSLLNEDGQGVALARDLNLDDLLFRYGVRINANLVADMYCTQIVLATGSGSGSEYNPLPWIYHPMVFSRDNHPINRNLEALRMQFASTIDTLENPYRKTILYESSPRSRAEGTPKLVSLELVREEPDPGRFVPGNLPLAVLVEGAFRSAYTNRIRPVDLPGYQEQGRENRMIVVSDGDLASNQLQNGRPLELGYDKWTNNFYGNKEFLVNAVNYLLEDNGLINIRNKEVAIPLLDPQRAAADKTQWQLLNIGLPVVLLLLFGGLFRYIRRRRYG